MVGVPQKVPDQTCRRAGIDEATPWVDARLHDGNCIHSVLPPISTGARSSSIRLPRVQRLGLSDHAAADFFSAIDRNTVERLVERLVARCIGSSSPGAKIRACWLPARRSCERPRTDRRLCVRCAGGRRRARTSRGSAPGTLCEGRAWAGAGSEASPYTPTYAVGGWRRPPARGGWESRTAASSTRPCAVCGAVESQS
jgi:hypothetical protein